MPFPGAYPSQTPFAYVNTNTSGPLIFPQQPQNPAPNSSGNNGIIWVQGESGAKAYPVGAGNTVLLMDSEDSKFYIKSTDISGMPQPLRTFSYSEIFQSVKTEPKEDYVTRNEFEELKKMLDELTAPTN